MTGAATLDSRDNFRYQWFSFGDLNGFFGLMFDNITVLSFMAFILTAFFGMPADIVFTKMFPGTAFGVLFGDLVYTWLAFRLAKRTKKNVTAMPLGLDTPSTIGVAFTVLGPAYKGYLASGLSPDAAALQTWYVGMAVMIYIGIFKTVFSFFGDWLNRIIPQAGLMGSLAGVGLALLGFVPLLDIMGAPLIGLVALGIVLYNLVAGIRLPFNLPGVLVGVVVGTALYYPLAQFGLVGGTFVAPSLELTMGFPWPNLGFVHGLVDGLKFLPIAIPFAILTVVGGINVTESARLAGDDYSTKEILLTEAIATLVAGVCGGVAQSTPYIGQPAFKAMGSRSGYTVLTGLFVGLGGMLGFVGFFVSAIPKAVLAPILVFVALSIICQSFQACPVAQFPAVAFSFFPNIARVLDIKINYAEMYQDILTQTGQWINEGLVIIAMGNGFILTAMLWGSFLSLMIDRRLKECSVYLFILGILAFFGVIHSCFPAGNMYLPWDLPTAAQRAIPYQFASGYFILGIMVYLLSFTKESQMSLTVDDEAQAQGAAPAEEEPKPEPMLD